ncbi:GATA transcription factor 21-like [Primulina eburnea]|uniref:GATA transcription factor 21-like n=1 Tax=Primulina eburnea TaxID=1245227 RepID=UPI003C6C484C
MNLNISPSPFTVEQQINGDIDQNPFSCQFLYNSIQNHTAGYCDHQLYKLQHRQQEGNFGFRGGSSSYNIKNKAEPGIKLTLWNDEDRHVTDETHATKDGADYKPVQWTPSKIILMQKRMKNSNPNHVTLKINSSVANVIDDQKIPASVHSWETDSSSGISYSNPFRVCSDCNTTKTPLWRSGPKGPKSLCNACGIRQRKARRAAMAAASAAANGMAAVLTDETPSLKTTIKLKKKEKISKKGNASNFKKHCKMAVTASGSSCNGDIRKKLDLEDFLINLSKNLAFRFRVFPQDEKDAAILLMALSSGLIDG